MIIKLILTQLHNYQIQPLIGKIILSLIKKGGGGGGKVFLCEYISEWNNKVWSKDNAAT